MPRYTSVNAAKPTLCSGPPSRTYFVGGHRVEQMRSADGQSSWACDCAEYVRGQQCGGGHWCQHAERVAAAAELDSLLRTPALICPATRY